MSDAKEIIAKLEFIDGIHSLYQDDRKTIDEAIEFIERLTKPMTLKECRDILNANEYSFDLWDAPWEVEGDVLYNGLDALTLFEANALSRAYMVQKEAGRG
ncbi:MAG: hypothetical protein P4L67_05155 [Candidatus Pacebacteria bacterium]|nr:hypothetical protein [Candidatus Paceibacterota bacterium]